MTWLHKNPRPHRCHKPRLLWQRVGSVWMCDNCTAVWVIHENSAHDRYRNKKWLFWYTKIPTQEDTP